MAFTPLFYSTSISCKSILFQSPEMSCLRCQASLAVQNCIYSCQVCGSYAALHFRGLYINILFIEMLQQVHWGCDTCWLFGFLAPCIKFFFNYLPFVGVRQIRILSLIFCFDFIWLLPPWTLCNALRLFVCLSVCLSVCLFDWTN